jgi:hypothetical protein
VATRTTLDGNSMVLGHADLMELVDQLRVLGDPRHEDLVPPGVTSIVEKATEQRPPRRQIQI